jgi:segregation and condensation protein A
MSDSEAPVRPLEATSGETTTPSGPWRIDLDVFEGPFDLLITLVLNEEIDLLELSLAEVVLAYLERLEARGELDLEAATEFLILIAALLELKSRLMLPGEEMQELEVDPQEAVEELLARLLSYRQFRDVADYLHQRFDSERGFRYRSAPLPPALRQVALEAARPTYEARRLAEAMKGLLAMPPQIDIAHLRRPAVSLEKRLMRLRELLGAKRRFDFEEAAGGDRQTQAVTLFALLELYKSGELTWRQTETFGSIEVMSKATRGEELHEHAD